jgi:hypothetical protein
MKIIILTSLVATLALSFYTCDFDLEPDQPILNQTATTMTTTTNTIATTTSTRTDANQNGSGCPEIYAPVCDKENNTYDNSCIAAYEGVDVVYDGTCSNYSPCEDLNCNDGYHCEATFLPDEGDNVQLEIPAECYSNDEYLIKYVISGGWQLHYEYRIYRNALIHISGSDGMGNEMEEWRESSASLLIDNYVRILDIGFFDFPDTYYGDINCCDQAYYFITVVDGDQEYTVEWHDFAEPSDEALQVQAWIKEIIDYND